MEPHINVVLNQMDTCEKTGESFLVTYTLQVPVKDIPATIEIKNPDADAARAFLREYIGANGPDMGFGTKSSCDPFSLSSCVLYPEPNVPTWVVSMNRRYDETE